MTVGQDEYLGGVGPTTGVYGEYTSVAPAPGAALDPITGKPVRVGGIKKTTTGFYQALPSYKKEDAIRWGTNKDNNTADMQQKLFNAGYYKKDEVPALGAAWTQQDVDALTRAMTDANLGGIGLQDNIAEKTAAVKGNARALFFGSSDFISGGAGGAGGGTDVAKYVTLTSSTNADQALRAKMLSVLGRLPTKNEYAQYRKQLNANEKKYFKQTRYLADGTQLTTGTTFDTETFTNSYVLGKANLTGDASGQLGEIQDAVNQLSADYGLNGFLSGDKKVKYLKSIASGELAINDLEQDFRNQAATIYTGFADLLKAKPKESLKDIASPYLNTYSGMLEIDSNSIDMKDALSKAMNADGTLMNVFDYKKSLYNDSRYQFTNRASQEAANFGREFARSMGVNL